MVLAGEEAPLVIAAGSDRVLKRYQLRREAAFWGGIAGRVLQPEGRAELLSKPATGMHAALGGAYLALCGQDGCVKVGADPILFAGQGP